jgi:hypothetical protein
MRSVLDNWDAAAREALSQYWIEKENNIKFELSKLSPQPHDIILLKMKTGKNGNLFYDVANMMDYAKNLADALDANGLKNPVVLLPDKIEVICKEDAAKFRLELEEVLSAVKKAEE